MRVYDFLLTVASQLGDARPNAPFRRYPLALLTAFYNEAMCFVATHRPDYFTDFKVVKLETGSYQDARCCGCSDVTAVVAQIDAEGNTLKDLSEVNSRSSDKSKWYRAPCKVSASGVETPIILSVAIEQGMNGVFKVTPPVPPNTDMWVKLRCVQSAPKICEADVLCEAQMGDCKFAPAVRSYILYRALQGDRHASGASSEALSELKNVYTYLGMVYKQEQDIVNTQGGS
jgi:hypothetical protein